MVQENKFPASISFTLVEPSSRLIWKTNYEPTTEIMNPSSFSVVDQGSFETFMTMVLDAVVPRFQSVVALNCDKIKSKGDWHNIQNKDWKTVIEPIEDNLEIKIAKEVGKVKIILGKPQND